MCLHLGRLLWEVSSELYTQKCPRGARFLKHLLQYQSEEDSAFHLLLNKEGAQVSALAVSRHTDFLLRKGEEMFSAETLNT